VSKYRLYIDESGTHSYAELNSIGGRYLALCGIVISAEHNEGFIQPSFEEIRRMFCDDIDLQPCFHYVDVISKRDYFGKLRNADFQESFNERYLNIIKNGQYIICCIVLDKKTHKERYGDSAMHPYHYCLNVLLERYIKFLGDNNAKGDVMAEARGSKEDDSLKREFVRFYQDGTSFIHKTVIQGRLTSAHLKLKTKESRVAGLELSDMLATPMKFLTLWAFKKHENLSDNFTKEILKECISKIRKGPFLTKAIYKGYGIKLIE
jgi:hypothetical protein